MGKEIELKFIIRKPSDYPDGTDVSRIEQYYLSPRDGFDTRRVRARTRNGVTSYTYNEKRLLSGFTREENEREIDEQEFVALLVERDLTRNAVCKTRYAFSYGGHVMEIDVFDFWSDVAILEIELSDENEPVRWPDDIRILRDVTSDKRFLNSSLALSVPDIGESGIQ